MVTSILLILFMVVWFVFCRALYYRQVFGRWVIKLNDAEKDQIDWRRF